MKTIATVIASCTLLTAVSFAQEDTSKNSSTNQSTSGSLIQEPSGAEPSQTPGYQPVPVDAAAGISVSNEVTSTITVSRTITNAPNTITIIGTVDSERQKQEAEMKLRDALQGKTINNLLIVSNSTGTINEPSGAEKSSTPDKSSSDEANPSQSQQ